MIVSALRIVRDALDDPTIGVNAQYAFPLPTDGTDPVPPDIEAVLEPTSDEDAAIGLTGDEWPVLVVTAGGITEADPEESAGVQDAQRVVMTIRYVTEEADPAEMRRHAYYTLRAIRRTFNALFRTSPNGSLRKRNNIAIVGFTTMTFADLWEPFSPEDADVRLVAASIDLDVYVRDLEPVGATV